MLDWVRHRVRVLNEILRLDGIQEHTSPPSCSNCLDDPGVHRCLDCSTTSLYCAVCIVSRHDEQPLHRIEVRSLALDFFLPNVCIGVVGRLLSADTTYRVRLLLLHGSPTYLLSIPERYIQEDSRRRPQRCALHQRPILRLHGEREMGRTISPITANEMVPSLL